MRSGSFGGRSRRSRGTISAESAEDLRIAKKAGDADEDVVVQLLDLLRVRAQHRDVLVDVRDSMDGHSPANAALERRCLVMREVDLMSGVEQFEDSRQVAIAEASGARGNRRTTRDLDELAADVRRRQDEVDGAGEH